ncbi:hypothetical protein A2U01_0095762, partial [Trifolium medium]|nr:hypothetical protein [Trifolium medium]
GSLETYRDEDKEEIYPCGATTGSNIGDKDGK